ncbi:MAG: O-antigen ligase family protein [Candidatus Absconditabacterales bacterium]
MDKNKLIKIATIITQIFLIGLLLQFLLQTFVTYKLDQSNIFRTMIWMRKEVILLGLAGFLVYILQKSHQRKSIWESLAIKRFIRVFLITLIISFMASVFFNQGSISIYIVSIRYSMIGFFIFILFFVLAKIFFGAREMRLNDRYARIIKTLLIWSLIWRGIIRLMPNLLKFVGYNPYNYEGGISVAPPAAYYTQYDTGYVRNQFLFERPISRGFFLVAFRPLFFVLCIKKKPLKEKFRRGSLYGLAILSTFSRAAWIAWIVQIIILLILQFRKRIWKLAIYRLLPMLIIFGGITYLGRDQIISRDFSNTGHLRLILEAVKKIGARPIWGEGAGSAGPASFYLGPGKSYNPENQYLQIWLEYGVFGFMGWMYLYLFLHRIGYKAYKDEKEQPTQMVKQTRNYGLILFAFSLGILGLSVEGLVLHSFVDRMIVYPFMALFGITYALYVKEKYSRQ